MKLSIITINYNNANGLCKTLQSALQQTCMDFQYVIIDGASTDSSVEVIRENLPASECPQIIWLSEHDTGIYNAMNKGIRMASGEYVLFLNSGDKLYDDRVVEDVLPLLDGKNEIISGGLQLVNGERAINLYPPLQVNLQQSISAGLTHPNTFIKRLLFDKYGLYNEHNKIVSDWEWFLQVCGLHKVEYMYTDRLISVFLEDGISSQAHNLLEKETEEALERWLPWHINLKRKLKRFIKARCSQ